VEGGVGLARTIVPADGFRCAHCSDGGCGMAREEGTVAREWLQMFVAASVD